MNVIYGGLALKFNPAKYSPSGLPFLNGDIFDGRSASEVNPDAIESGNATTNNTDALDGGDAT